MTNAFDPKKVTGPVLLHLLEKGLRFPRACPLLPGVS